MAELSLCSNFVTPSRPAVHHHCYLKQLNVRPTRLKTCVTVSAAKSGGLSINPFAKKCEKCTGQGAIECPGCKGTGRNKKNGNIFERWKCFECQGFGMKTCPECGKGEGLTPEQRGER